ncbi:ABC-F family ATP-binding cassette domain-containing protein [Pseudoclavibacter chungangensis]|uniref:ABC-F family ATP-binding cassette domain-containing protein n=1 Tax=Pseudoclavibacter chungangensis TaxID=587635 RepID=A0A7J5BUL6_9MICO|nr:ABC-F family ATP-binding cassette domain-containing protein [Pseudoclavibacter chungangensis]KAB1657978.1 ABC-F family ATP-binding cassette domain-containing protein [Pseudoclavibacter chungangensis]NYJ65866.1 ATPase subunit of ABC transporter with duplicated ATPase domains [Pseudoclavibacter chungangensis]
MAHLLGAEQLRLEYPTRVVFDDITVGIAEGDRIGVVGRNGDGKSTLLKLLAGRLEPDAGQVTSRRGVRIGMLDQGDTIDPELTVGAAIVGDRAEYEWAGDARVRDVIDGLVADLDWHARVGDLSGGQQRRVALAQVLVEDHDIVFLDEPTNHLDVEGIAWLAQHLGSRWSPSSGALVVVTHDRWFLDAVCTTTWEVHDRIIEPFEGGYAAYVLQRVERDRQAAAVEQKRQNLMRKELAWLRRGAPARTSKPKFRIEAANALIEDVPPVRNAVELQQMATARLGKDVVDLLDAGVRFGEREVLRDIEWRIAPGERTGILGVNGAGKSTLLKLVSGELEPTSGRVKTGTTVRIATLSQRLAELDEHGSRKVFEVLARLKSSYATGGSELTPAQLLERLGFTSAQLQTPVSDLSGGQRRRLQFLLVLLGEPNVLILDEPTNDLDTDMLAAMEDLLDTWPGTLVVVSHDRYLLERVTDQQYAVWHGGLRHLPGGVDEYLELRRREQRGDGPSTATATSPLGGAGVPTATDQAATDASAAASEPAPTRLAGAERRAREKELQSVQRRLDRVSSEQKAIDERLFAHDPGDYDGLRALGEARDALATEQDDLELRWLDLSEQLEA